MIDPAPTYSGSSGEDPLELALRSEANLARPEPPSALRERILGTLADAVVPEPASLQPQPRRAGLATLCALAATVALVLVPFLVPAEPARPVVARSGMQALDVAFELARLFGDGLGDVALEGGIEGPLAAEGRLLLADATRAGGALERFFAPLVQPVER